MKHTIPSNYVTLLVNSTFSMTELKVGQRTYRQPDECYPLRSSSVSLTLLDHVFLPYSRFPFDMVALPERVPYIAQRWHRAPQTSLREYSSVTRAGHHSDDSSTDIFGKSDEFSEDLHG